MLGRCVGVFSGCFLDVLGMFGGMIGGYLEV